MRDRSRPDMQIGAAPRAAIGRMLGLAAWLTILFSLATAFDQYHRYLELFSHFRLQYFCGSLLLTLLLAGFGRWRLFALMLAIAATNGAMVLPWYTGERESADRETLTLLLANVQVDNGDARPLIDLVERETPDLLLVLELAPGFREQLTALDAEYPYRVTDVRHDPFGIGLWSRRPISASAVITTPPRGLPSLSATVDFAGSDLTVVGTHPINPLGSANYAARNTQLAALGDLSMATQGSVVLAGDLNISMWAANYEALESRTGFLNARRGFGVLPTWPTFLPLAAIPIDHVLLSRDLAAIDTRIPGDAGSDHWPLLVDIARRKRQPAEYEADIDVN